MNRAEQSVRLQERHKFVKISEKICNDENTGMSH